MGAGTPQTESRDPPRPTSCSAPTLTQHLWMDSGDSGPPGSGAVVCICSDRSHWKCSEVTPPVLPAPPALREGGGICRAGPQGAGSCRLHNCPAVLTTNVWLPGRQVGCWHCTARWTKQALKKPSGPGEAGR